MSVYREIPEVTGRQSNRRFDPTGFLIKPRSRAYRSLFVLARRALSGYF
jgi:hypothetical protein